MKYYANDIYPIALVISYDAESVDKEYYNAAEGEDEKVYIKPTSEAVTMFLTRRTHEYYAMAVGIIFNKKPTAKLMAHEAFHATVMMLDVGVNIPLNNYTEEAYAYVIGWVNSCIEDYVKLMEEEESER